MSVRKRNIREGYLYLQLDDYLTDEMKLFTLNVIKERLNKILRPLDGYIAGVWTGNTKATIHYRVNIDYRKLTPLFQLTYTVEEMLSNLPTFCKSSHVPEWRGFKTPWYVTTHDGSLYLREGAIVEHFPNDMLNKIFGEYYGIGEPRTVMKNKRYQMYKNGFGDRTERLKSSFKFRGIRLKDVEWVSSATGSNHIYLELPTLEQFEQFTGLTGYTKYQ